MSGTCNVFPYLWDLKHFVQVCSVRWYDDLIYDRTNPPINPILPDGLPSQLYGLIALQLPIVEVL